MANHTSKERETQRTNSKDWGLLVSKQRFSMFLVYLLSELRGK